MRVGWIGLGKLGLPCALALERVGGHDLIGYDVNPAVAQYLDQMQVPYREEGVEELLSDTQLKLVGSIAEVCAQSDIVFVAVQTPHAPDYEGASPTPSVRRDFEYGYLASAVRAVCAATRGRADPLTLAVVSTVLPGTSDRLIRPLLHPGVRYVYNPAFIAMGTTIPDYLAPDLVLAGSDDPVALDVLADVYRTVHDKPLTAMNIASAELTKVAYNTAISAKIVLANTLMEVCHHTGADVDEVTGALAAASGRITSGRYMRGGMGDGGGCHPRDNIAMSWLAERLELSYDLFGQLTAAREHQSWFLARLVKDWAALTGLSVAILGEAYKPETDLTVGSPARLLAWQLGDCVIYDPHSRPEAWPPPNWAAVYVIGTRHDSFASFAFPAGSVVVDPWRYIPDQPDITVIRVGGKA